MKSMILACAFALALALLPGHQASAIEDTPQNRLAASERYARAIDAKKMLRDTIAAIEPTLKPAEASAIRQLIENEQSVRQFEKDIIDLMARFFNTDELTALADFYGSNLGQGISQKFPAYMAASQTAILGFLQRGLMQQKL